jgi:DNA-binding transcriptional LysR family regulator
VVDISFTMLDAFRTLARRRSIAQAAEELHVTQSGLTQSITALEKRLGTKLLVHTRAGLTLTKAGDSFYTDLLDPLAAFSAGCTTIFGVGPAEQAVNVAFSLTTEHQIIDPLRRRCEGTGLRLSLHRMWTSDIPTAIEAGDFDVGFTRHPEAWGQLRVELLWNSPLIATVPLWHPLADRAEISIRELADEMLVILPRRLSPGPFDVVESACLRAGFTPRFANVSQSGRTGKHSLNNEYVGIGPQLADDEVPDRRVIPLKEPYTMGLHVVTRYADAAQGPVSQVLALARAIADERELAGQVVPGS